MKKILSMILAAVLLLSCSFSLAEAPEGAADSSAAAEGGLGRTLMKTAETLAGVGNLIRQFLAPLTGETETAAPAEEPEPAASDPAEWKTLADVLALETDGMERGTNGMDQYYLAFRYGGRYWMVTAGFSEELFRKLMNIDIFADDRKEQELAILGPCEIQSAVDLATRALPQEELDKWIGRTGGEMLEAGWEINGYTYEREGIRINMINGRFQYLVAFAEEIEVPQSFGDAPDIADRTISGIRFAGHSYHYFDGE